MTDSAWERLTDAIDGTVGIDRHGHDKHVLPDAPKLTQSIEFFEFSRGSEAYRLERSTGPAIVDRKTHYASRAGAANRIEIIYDETEIAHKVTLFRQVDGDWQAIDLNQLGL